MMNYTTALPDFIEMQRVSFCWFIAQGLNEELNTFSRIYDFSQNTEYVLFGQEYTLVKPIYNIVRAKKYTANYSAQLVIPLEVRNKKTNVIKYHSKFPIINLPLMTSSATFVINGCERVIVSQIIRSPGVYFEKNKHQKKNKKIKRIVSSEIEKLKSFTPPSEILPTESRLYVLKPTIKKKFISDKKKKVRFIKKEEDWNWQGESINIYSFKQLKNYEINFSSSFIEYLKVYKSLFKIQNLSTKIKRIKIFLKWLASNENFILQGNQHRIFLIVNCFNLLIKTIVKYKILKKRNDSNNNQSLLKKFKQIKNLYNKIFQKSETLVSLNFNLELLTFLLRDLDNFSQINNFNFLKLNIIPKIQVIINSNKIQSNLYFTNSFKELIKFKYNFTKKEKDKRRSQLQTKIFKNKTKYLKTKSKIIQYKDDHLIKDIYKEKYEEKELYTATLIPEYGSWIRFGFQKNTKINLSKYPIKNQEDEIIIQLDKVTQKPIIHLLREMGVSDLEICQNLQNSEFFYFNKPLLSHSIYQPNKLLRFNLNKNYYKNISEFSRIFDPSYYRLGKIGRSKLNNRLNIKLSKRINTITYEDIFAIIDKLITLSTSKQISDDIDHLKNRRVRSVGELLQNLFRIGFQRLLRKLRSQTNKTYSSQLSSFNIVGATIREFFGASQLSQYMDQTNPLSALTHRRRISGLGPGGFDRDRISFAVRDIHPSHYGRICPIETPEGQNVGLIASLTTCARVNESGFLETPFWRVINGKVIKTGHPIYLTADIEDFYKIAPADISTNENNYLTKNLIPVRYKQDFLTVTPSEVDFIGVSPIQVVSVAASLIPFFEHDDANRALMGSNMQRQSVPLLLPQKPIVGTGLENQIALDSGMVINAQRDGIVESVSANKIIIRENSGRHYKYDLQKYQRSNQETCINHRPIVWEGEKIKSGQMLTDGPGIISSELSLGQNVLVAYMPWQGYNFEDAILINERLVYEDIFTSIHIERYEIEIDRTAEMSEQTTNNIPNLSISDVQNLNEDGIVTIGTFVKPGDILVGKIIPKDDSEQLPESKLLRAIFGAKAKGVRDTSFRMPEGEYGRVIETLTFNRRTKLAYKFEKIQIFIAQIRKIQVGDKIAGRHGNKGIISRILARQDMPFLPDGTPIDIILNPLGVPSRMNVGQLYECLLGLAGHKLNRRFKILPFDEMYGSEVSRILINKKLRQASIENNEAWLFNPYSPGKMVLLDGRTGKEFDNPITVGNAYMLKLIHLVDDKMHSRATGPYSLVTQQPLGGKAQHGGQRFGEMEVWALEGFGASFTLKELLTIKSDDMQGRNETLNSIIKGQPIPTSGVPESFKVLVQELRSIGLDLSTYRIDEFSSDESYEIELNLIEKYNPLLKTFSHTSNINNISF
jgi:DNA-directed RNA polymerase, beta subunit/140 kD subunit|uniref:RNA polymerase beta subunit n=1 Tax=Stephanodiscus niagarae TaxID=29208 RepID=UPI0023F03F6C|nr:RNA polymerase beta subunit [Stephanodiscus niagarae]WDZ67067.1 RNA polymerase beta subunit [Stephanodiscus niagarae]